MHKRGHRYIFIARNHLFFNNKPKAFRGPFWKGRVYISWKKIFFFNPAYVTSIIKKENIDLLQNETPQAFLRVDVPTKITLGMPAIVTLRDVENQLNKTPGINGKKNIFLDYAHREASHWAHDLCLSRGCWQRIDLSRSLCKK